jgi:signal transduction histidine kinase
MANRRTLTPGYVVVYPNREKAASKATKATVALILLISVALMLIITIGGWSKLQGLKPINLLWCVMYVLIAYYVMTRWARGLLPIASALAILLLILALISGTGVSGTSWFDRNHTGFGTAHTPFGGVGLDANMLGLLTVILIPVQAVLILFAMRGFAQSWNVEVEVPEEEAKKKGYKTAGPPPTPAAA